MAKVIRRQWVYQKNNRIWRTLPRRHDGRMSYDYEAPENSLVKFDNPMLGYPPKLWVAWINRNISKMSQKVQYPVKVLFGDKMEAGKMNVFKNTVSTNKELWKIKHLIEVRPIYFPNGEPTLENIKNMEIISDGKCIIDEKLLPDPEGVNLFDPLKQFTHGYLSSKLKSRDVCFKEVYEDTVYHPSNISVIE